MFNSIVLDVGIGLIFVYLLLALICTVLNEWLATWRDWRARTLDEAIRVLLGARAEEFYAHPAIAGFAPQDKRPSLLRFLGKHDTWRPSYISPRSFAIAFQEIAGGRAEDKAGRILKALEEDAKRRGVSLHVAVEGWFSDAMDRVSGQYKRKLSAYTVGLAVLVTIAANADTIDIATKLWSNPALRAAIVEEARVRAQKEPPLNVEYPNPDSPTPSDPVITPPQKESAYELSEKERELLGQLIGWAEGRKRWAQRKEACIKKEEAGESCGIIVERVKWFGSESREQALGWLLTAIAVSLGAPFWFDMLNKILRATGRKPEPAQAEEKPK